MKEIRKHAGEWHVDENKIILLGFSAGGHLAASYGVFWQQEAVAEAIGCESEMLRPNGLVLCYPVISSKEEIAHTESMQNLLGTAYEEKKRACL